MQILISEYLKRTGKRLQRKYPKLKTDLIECLNQFSDTNAINLGNGLFKVRMKSSNINKGKRNSLRLVILLIFKDQILTPIYIYEKSEYNNVKKPILLFHLKQILKELSEY